MCVCVCVCVLKWAVVEVCCGLAVVTDGNVLSRSHEELQLLSKTGSAVTALSVCLSLLENSFSLFPFTTLPRHNLDTSVHGFYTDLCVWALKACERLHILLEPQCICPWWIWSLLSGSVYMTFSKDLISVQFSLCDGIILLGTITPNRYRSYCTHR